MSSLRFTVRDVDVTIPEGIPVEVCGYRFPSGPVHITLDGEAPAGSSGGSLDYEANVARARFRIQLDLPELRSARLGRERIVDPDEVIRRDPEGIVASWCGKAVRREKIASRPGWNALTAVQRGQIYEIKSALILQPGPAALTDGLSQLQEIVVRVARAAHGGREAPARSS